MVYVVLGAGTPSPLDKEHIVNVMFKATNYGKKVYFFKNVEVCDIAYQAAQQWKTLNDFKAELIMVDENDAKDRAKLPQVFDCILYFIDQESRDNAITQEQLKVMEEEGIRYEMYVLGSWDKTVTH
jgi:hypothetical protein